MFHIPVQLSGLEKRRRSIGLLHLVAGFFLIANSESAVALRYQRLGDLAPLYIIAALSLVYGVFRKRVDPNGKANLWIRLLQSITFLSLAIAFMQTGNQGKTIGIFIWAGLAAMLAFTERVALRKSELLVSASGIAFPNGFTTKKMEWTQINEISVRPDFLTFHLPSNKFLQLELAEPLPETTAQKLQDFCRQQINQAVVNS